MVKNYLIIITLIGMIIFSAFNSVSSFSDINNNEVEYWGVLLGMACQYERFSYIQDILCSHGWEEDHFNITSDNNTHSFTKQDLIEVLTWLDEKEDENDIVLIYIEAHGNSHHFFLSDGGVSYEELNSELNHLESKAILIILVPCYSGGAIPFLEKDGRVIITSCAVNETSIGFEGSFEFGLGGLGDLVGDNNNIVSAEEIYQYISMINISGKHPQMSDNFTGNLNILNLKPEDKLVDQKQILYDTHLIHPLSLENDKFIAQSFVPSISPISKIKIGMAEWWYNSCSVKLSIRKELISNNLTSIILDESEFYKSTKMLVEFDIPDIEVIPGETYYIVCNLLNATIYDGYVLKTNKNDIYTDGNLLISQDSGETWFTNNYYQDLLFLVYGKSEPVLSIESINGGNGLNTIIQNHGNENANNISVSIAINGGLLIYPSTMQYEIPFLSVGELKVINMSVFGIGLGIFTDIPKITVNAECEEGSYTEKSVDARIFLFRVSIRE